jgi:hypothetical protein
MLLSSFPGEEEGVKGFTSEPDRGRTMVLLFEREPLMVRSFMKVEVEREKVRLRGCKLKGALQQWEFGLGWFFVERSRLVRSRSRGWPWCWCCVRFLCGVVETWADGSPVYLGLRFKRLWSPSPFIEMKSPGRQWWQSVVFAGALVPCCAAASS